jgi:hypothetical protein
MLRAGPGAAGQKPPADDVVPTASNEQREEFSMIRHLGPHGVAFTIMACLAAAPAQAQVQQPADPATARESKSAAPEPAKVPEQGRFRHLLVGMHTDEVNEVLAKAPDGYHTYESGKRWIPFYFGQDAVRLQALFKGEGCLVFSVGLRFQSHGTEWKDVSGTLLEIVPDTSGKCYQP